MSLEELCKPIIEYIKENHNPHTEVVITLDGITVKQDIEGIPVKETEPGVTIERKKRSVTMKEFCTSLKKKKVSQGLFQVL